VFLKVGESRTVTMRLSGDAFHFFHPVKRRWLVEPGEFEILVGSSSREIRLKKRISVEG
jgi:beta-glucosidase